MDGAAGLCVIEEIEKQPSGDEEAAEKVRFSGGNDERQTSGPEGHDHFVSLMARINPCPFKAVSRLESFRSL